MEILFNIAWVLLGLSGIATAMVLRRRLMPWKNRDLARDVFLLVLITFVLFPVISMSDDIGYFNYYFAGNRTADSLYWVSGLRREKQVPSLVVPQLLAFLLAAAIGALYQRKMFGCVDLRRPAPLVGRSVTTAGLRAPPLHLL